MDVFAWPIIERLPRSQANYDDDTVFFELVFSIEKTDKDWFKSFGTVAVSTYLFNN